MHGRPPSLCMPPFQVCDYPLQLSPTPAVRAGIQIKVCCKLHFLRLNTAAQRWQGAKRTHILDEAMTTAPDDIASLSSWELPAAATSICSWKDEKIAISLATETATVAIFDGTLASVVRGSRCHVSRNCLDVSVQPSRILDTQDPAPVSCMTFHSGNHPVLACCSCNLLCVFDLDEASGSGGEERSYCLQPHLGTPQLAGTNFAVNSITGEPTGVAFDASGRVVAVSVGRDVVIVDYKVRPAARCARRCSSTPLVHRRTPCS